MNILQKIKKFNSAIMFIVFILGAIAVFIFSFFSSPELVVALRVITFIILLIPIAIIFLIKPLFALLLEGIRGETHSHTSLRIDDPKDKDWLFSDERLYGTAGVAAIRKSIDMKVKPDPLLEDDLIRAHEIESDTITRRKRYFARGGKPYQDAYPDLHTEMLKDYMAGGKIREIETEEEKIKKLRRNPKVSKRMDSIEEIIENLHGKDVKIHSAPKGIIYSFNFGTNHKFSIFIGATIRLDAESKVILEAILKTYQPFSLSLLDLENNENDKKDEIKGFEKYTINTTYSLDYKKILEKEKFRDAFSNLQSKLERLVISEKFLSLSLKDPKGVSQALELTKEIYKELLLLDLGVVEISEVRCYTCDAEFKTDVEKCPKCGALRPRCIVCSLDLFPSEKAKIISLPCCGVLTHKDHIIMWLRKNKTCPNCKKSLSQWLDKLDITDI